MKADLRIRKGGYAIPPRLGLMGAADHNLAIRSDYGAESMNEWWWDSGVPTTFDRIKARYPVSLRRWRHPLSR